MFNWVKFFFSKTKIQTNPNSELASKDGNLQHQALTLSERSIRLKNQGDSYLNQGNLTEASVCYRQAVNTDPNYVEAYCNLGFVLMQQGLASEAETMLKKALSLDNTNADIHYMLGNLAIMSHNNLVLGCEYFQKAVELRVDFDVAYLDWRRFMTLSGQQGKLKQLLIVGLQKKPERADFHGYLGNIYQDELHFDLAIESFQHALEIRPENSEILANLSFVLSKCGHHEQANAAYESAIDCYRKLIALSPNDVEAHFKLGKLYATHNHHTEALACFNHVMSLNSNYEPARIGRGLISLLIGQFENGWKDCKNLAKQTALSRPVLRQALWLNDADLKGKSILLFADQGLGDTIQFARYAEQVSELGATVYLQVHASLKPLLGTLPGHIIVLGERDILPDVDYQCPLSNLPLAFNTSLDTIPNRVPYLTAPVEQLAVWKKKLAHDTQPRIGVVWSGNPLFMNDKYRSIHLQSLTTILVNGDRHFFLLQKEVRTVDAPHLPSLMNVTDLGPQLTDFAETAAVIANLDLVITVDTSVAHLAGALGKPVWIMLPYAPDFRWLMDRLDSPWYPTARLFRQHAIGDWDAVLKEVKEAIEVEFY